MHPTLRLSRSTISLNILRTTAPTFLSLPIPPANPRVSCLRFTHRYFSDTSSNRQGEKPSVKDLPASPASRELEHPGPPPPDTRKPSVAPPSEQQIDADRERRERHQQKQRDEAVAAVAEGTTSTGAKPTITSGSESPNIDAQGRVKEDVPEDVRRHNKEMEGRYDRAYNQIADEGTHNRGIWQGDNALRNDQKGGSS
ncbi:serine-rich protein [Talaromyces proteolyticus]|uniref:Serine-rich protein n=1 Tax=Talaromyces proteolyticus TaxID=1131652 RepID=A0AAD4PYM1_9EURO|nr:serine-rich protein [Talaromyces proteolyticus]KAH8695308.1 serine-rich protein [Talaromyces proteolyticus]